MMRVEDGLQKGITMLSYDERQEIMDAGLHNDTYFDKIEAREREAKAQATRTQRRLRRMAARLHQMAHDAWHSDDYHTMEVCQTAAYGLDAEAPPTKAQARRNVDQAAARYRYENPDSDYSPFDHDPDE